MVHMSKVSSGTTTGLLLLLAIAAALVTYKTSGALSTMSHVSSAGTLSVRAGIIELTAPGDLSTVTRTFNYLALIWPALAFGILISAAVRSFVPATVLSDVFGRSPARAHLIAGASGSPLMLCSCCVAPIFSAVYERSARLGPSLALMVAAPAFNPAALILTFMLFPLQIGVARVVMSTVAVFAGTALVARIFAGGAVAANITVAEAASCEAAGPSIVRFVRSCFYVAGRTIPLLVVGVVVGMAISDYLPAVTFTSWRAQAAVIAVTALIAVPIALPTFFEVPLALALLSAGAPAGAAVALLFAGPAVNLPSLFTVGRSAGWKVSAGLAVMVWVVAMAGALLVS
jgi:uncharacterized membrane protein YraQ (UPF0718 family)